MKNNLIELFEIPDSDETDIEDYIFKGHKRIAILSDIHIPYHDKIALKIAMEYCMKEKPDGILLNGDLLDCYQLSRYLKDPTKKNFKKELDTMIEILELIQRKISKAKIYYKLGNHDIRYENFLIEKAPQLVDLEEFRFESIIKKRIENVEIIGDNVAMKMNDLYGYHGHELRGSGGKNVAQSLYSKVGVSAFQGHNHRSDSHLVKTADGGYIKTYGIGCLCKMKPDYATVNQWCHGFAIVELDSNGKEFDFRNKQIINGKVIG